MTTRLLVSATALAICLQSFTVEARQTSLVGSLSITQDYDSNVHRTKSGEVDQWRTTLSPALRLQSIGESDSITLGYSPGIVYNYLDDDVLFNHTFSLRATKALTQNWTIGLADTFVKSDDPNTLADSDPQAAVTPLSGNRDRNRYWTNTLALNTDYIYTEGSTLRAGYSHSTLDNATIGSDYNRDMYSAGISHRHSSEWRWGADYQLSLANFDDRADINTHTPSVRLDYSLSPQQSIFGRYAYGHTSSQGTTDNYDTHTIDLGMTHAINSQSSLSGYGGYSTVKGDNRLKTDAFSYGLNYSRQELRSTITLGGAGGLQDQNYSGIDNTGLSRYWSFNGAVTYQLLESLSWNGSAGVRLDEFLERTQNPKEKSYNASTGLNYAFLQWYSLGTAYSFRRLDADDNTSDYDDHQLFVTLSASKEMWRW